MLPNYENAFIDIRKLRGYCLSETHPVGKHKAFLFKTLMGFDSENAEELKEIILTSIRENEAEKGVEDEFGARYTVQIRVEKNNREIRITTSWIIKIEEDFPRLTTCYIKN